MVGVPRVGSYNSRGLTSLALALALALGQEPRAKNQEPRRTEDGLRVTPPNGGPINPADDVNDTLEPCNPAGTIGKESTPQEASRRCGGGHRLVRKEEGSQRRPRSSVAGRTYPGMVQLSWWL
jgi:hypothetical protein